MAIRRTIAAVVLGIACTAASASAQPLGTLRWQLQPHCNVLTVNITQQGGIYTVDGTDDRCGGGNQPGNIVGIAYLTPLGQVGFGVTSVLPNGTPIHTEATINIASLNGTWRDSAGNSGNYVLTPGAGIGGAPRPVSAAGLAPASVTNVLIAPNAVTGANVTDGSLSIADLADAPRASFASSDQDLPLAFPGHIIRSVSIAAPAAGKLLAHAAGYFSFPSAAVNEIARCSLTTGIVMDQSAMVIAGDAIGGQSGVGYTPLNVLRGFNVTAGASTINLICDATEGAPHVIDTSLNVIFIPGS